MSYTTKKYQKHQRNQKHKVNDVIEIEQNRSCDEKALKAPKAPNKMHFFPRIESWKKKNSFFSKKSIIICRVQRRDLQILYN